jgi:hypothetical protein
VGDVVVAGCSKQKTRDKIIRWYCFIKLWSILAHIFYDMKRITISAFTILTASILFCCGGSADKRAAEVDKKLEGKKLERTAAPAPNDLPNMTISFLDGSQTQAKELEGKTILILYFPDCDHCQREATQIQKNIDGFKDHTVYFLTVAPRQEAEKFAVDYKLNNVQNVKFGFVTVNDVLTNFGNIDTPAMYIYSQERKLVKEFIGENDINLILKYVI